MCGRIIQASGPIRYMSTILTERFLRRTLIVIALGGLVLGLLAWAIGRGELANWIWAAGTAPVVIGLLISMIRDLLAGRMGVDAIAFVSMSAALALGENLAGVVVAVMYAGGNVLEDFAIARAERDLKSLIDRAPRIAHRRQGSSIADIPIEQVVVGDVILVRAGEVIPIDGIIISSGAMIDEAVLTGEPIPVTRREGESARSGTVNAGRRSKFGQQLRRVKARTQASSGWSMRLRPQRHRLPASRIVMRCCCFQSLSSSLAVPGFCRATPFEDWPCWSPRPHVR